MKTTRICLSLSLTLVLTSPLFAATNYIATALQPYLASGELPGAISVLYNNGVEEVNCLGYADTRVKRAITLDDAFMQCSQTKGFCGVTVAKLVEEGRLNLDDPVSKYLYGMDNLWIDGGETNEIAGGVTNRVRRLVKAKNALTVRMCLNHTGGFPFEIAAKNGHVIGGGWSGGMPLQSVAASAAAAPIRFEPGTDVLYSNTGIDIAAAVVEVVTGKKWNVYLKEAVLDPLGMTSTTFWPTDVMLAKQIHLYSCRANSPAVWQDHAFWQHRPYGDSHVFPSAGAGLWTTARDQLKFYKMLMNLGVGDNGVRILREETVKNLLATPSRPACVKDRNYSLGLSCDPATGWFGHGGAWGTNCSVNWKTHQLKLWIVQLIDGPRPWDGVRAAAENGFFSTQIDNSGVDAYTGRTK